MKKEHSKLQALLQAVSAVFMLTQHIYDHTC
jgi:hypothetical protein